MRRMEERRFKSFQCSAQGRAISRRKWNDKSNCKGGYGSNSSNKHSLAVEYARHRHSSRSLFILPAKAPYYLYPSTCLHNQPSISTSPSRPYYLCMDWLLPSTSPPFLVHPFTVPQLTHVHVRHPPPFYPTIAHFSSSCSSSTPPLNWF